MTDIEKKKAEAEIAKWFWQPAEGHNFRYKYAIRTLTRFYEMVTPAADTLKLVLEYLRTQEIEGPISLLGKKADLGSGWVAKDAWYTTATGDQFANTKQDKVRVYQTLMLAAEDAADGDGPYTVEDGCQYAIDHTFYWNVAELPTLQSSSSGVQYTMQGVTRDGDTGLFSCVIEKRERVQQDVELYDTAKTIFETVQEEQHLGVKADDVATTGQKASSANGVITKRQLRKNPDCTTDVINETTTEEPVSNAVVQYRKTLRGTIQTTTDRNQAAPLTGTGLAVGETRRSEKTPGGRYNNTTEAVTTEAAGEIQKDCAKTIFEHQDTTVTNQLNEPTEKEASAAGSGKTYRKTTRKTDDNTFDVTEQETTEEPVSNAVVQYRKTLRGTIQTTTDRNQEQPLAGTGLAVGETRRSEKTPGGRYNNTTEAVTTEAAGKIVDGLDKETVKSTTFVTTNQATDPGTITLTAEVNKSKRKVSRKTDAANWDVEEQETDYTPVQTLKTWTDERGTHVYCSYRNQTQPLTPGAPDGGGTWTNTTASFSENDHGSFDGSYTCFQVAAPSEAGKTLQYETEANVSTKFYYQKAGGEMVYRNITGTRHLAYGQAKHIMSEIKGAEECALVGWRTSVGDGPGIVSAHWYTGIVVGNESKLSSSSQEA